MINDSDLKWTKYPASDQIPKITHYLTYTVSHVLGPFGAQFGRSLTLFFTPRGHIGPDYGPPFDENVEIHEVFRLESATDRKIRKCDENAQTGAKL